ncbi:atherin-like [Canis lupus dingo]|uniref:atherin-like n=1 Tax=Canis lupus dingo TaxID=286419 RepID=UPI0020C2FCBA|nr:atherin-like [Canis lupus dingo]
MQAGPAGLLLRLQAPHAIAPHAPRPKRHHREAARACSIAATVAVPHVAGTQNRQEFKSSGRAAGSIRRPGPRQKPSEAPSAGLWGSEAPQTALVRSTGARARGPARRLTAPGGSALPARPFPPLRPPHPPGGRNPGGRARGHRAHTDRLPEATSSPRGATAASPKRLRRGRQARRHLPPEAAPHLAAPTATATAAAAAAALTGEEAAESAQPSRLLSRDKLPRSKGPPRLTRQPSPPRRTRAQAPPLGRAGRRAGHAGSRSFPARSWGGAGQQVSSRGRGAREHLQALPRSPRAPRWLLPLPSGALHGGARP